MKSSDDLSKALPVQSLRAAPSGEPYQPRRMSEDAAGYDLFAAIDEPVTLAPRERARVPCGFKMALPRGWEAQVRPRSGLVRAKQKARPLGLAFCAGCRSMSACAITAYKALTRRATQFRCSLTLL